MPLEPISSPNRAEVEARAFSTVKAAVDAARDTIKQAGFVADLRAIERWGVDESYGSELRLYFYKDAELVDALEYLLFLSGDQRIELENLSQVIEQDIDAVLAGIS